MNGYEDGARRHAHDVRCVRASDRMFKLLLSRAATVSPARPRVNRDVSSKASSATEGSCPSATDANPMAMSSPLDGRAHLVRALPRISVGVLSPGSVGLSRRTGAQHGTELEHARHGWLLGRNERRHGIAPATLLMMAPAAFGCVTRSPCSRSSARRTARGQARRHDGR
jgi:hypothetical protein